MQREQTNLGWQREGAPHGRWLIPEMRFAAPLSSDYAVRQSEIGDDAYLLMHPTRSKQIQRVQHEECARPYPQTHDPHNTHSFDAKTARKTCSPSLTMFMQTAISRRVHGMFHILSENQKQTQNRYLRSWSPAEQECGHVLPLRAWQLLVPVELAFLVPLRTNTMCNKMRSVNVTQTRTMTLLALMALALFLLHTFDQ
jgi:hypothetical protein